MVQRILTYLFLLLLVSFPFGAAIAQTETETETESDLTIEWEAPATRVDGTPLPSDEIDSYGLVCQPVNDSILENTQPEYTIPNDAGGEVNSHSLNRAEVMDGPGEYDCAMNAKDTDGLVSKWSDAVTYTWELGLPLAPAFSLSGDAPAGGFAIVWDTPTEREGGTAISADEITGYRIACVNPELRPSADMQGYEIPAESPNNTHVVTYEDILSQHGTYACFMRTVLASGEQSAWSAGSVEISWEQVEPNPPTNVLIIRKG